MGTFSHGRSRVGRGIVYALFYGTAIFMGLCLCFAVAQSLYGKPPAPRAEGFTRSERAWCMRSLEGLSQELEAQVRLELQYPPRNAAPLARWRHFGHAWEDKRATAQQRCEASGQLAMGEAFDGLKRLHEHYDAGLGAIVDRGQTERATFRAALDQLKKSW